jgi:hypothetical protein
VQNVASLLNNHNVVECLQQIVLIKFYSMLLKQAYIFFFKGFNSMMFFLILDILN